MRTVAAAVGFVLLALSIGLVAGCGSDSSTSSTRSGPTAAQLHAAQRAQERAQERRARERAARRRAQLQERREREQARQAEAALGCPDANRVLAGVYHPERLDVLDSCRKVTGTVEDVRDEEDGDIHILLDLDPQYRDMLMSANFSVQHGDLVVEFMPRDYGHLPRPSIGDQLTLVGAYVDDTEHSWAELHPVWLVSINGGAVHTSGPQYGGSPAYARSENAIVTCRTNTGARCMGYNGEAAPPPSEEPEPATGGGGSGGGNCTPGYSPCLSPASDYDCAGGGGDGPSYADGPVQVTGSDPYGLDSDGDGVACE